MPGPLCSCQWTGPCAAATLRGLSGHNFSGNNNNVASSGSGNNVIPRVQRERYRFDMMADNDRATTKDAACVLSLISFSLR